MQQKKSLKFSKDVTESNLVTNADLEIALEKTKAEIIKWIAEMFVAQAVVTATGERCIYPGYIDGRCAQRDNYCIQKRCESFKM